ncbi:PD-(D/E)XK nuclease family protein [Emticicia fluvialis]|uniref:PD-(D/E)XK nuclease family protein n=1 Tax=Emticicia fluvialis TaxID=2974474 RepID=UPI002166436C|nr:PD-(D/E)XK nuclease family protein [Emticicia fluvialis]
MLTKNNETLDVEVLLNNAVLFKAEEVYEPNILELAKVNNKELPVSNLYAYFLNPKESHDLGSIFIDTLLEIIKQKGFHLSLELPKLNIRREVPTGIEEKTIEVNGNPPDNHKYIDLLVSDSTNYLIIENKIFANVYNDLEKYYSSIKVKPENKVGVVLCLKKVYNLHPCFLEITHQELYEEIEKRFTQSIVSLKPRQSYNYYSFLEILKTHYTIMENAQERINFFTANEQKIVQLNTQLHELRNYFIKRIKQIGQNAFVESGIDSNNKDYEFEFSILNSCLKGRVYLHDYTINPIRVGIFIVNNKELSQQWFNKIKFQSFIDSCAKKEIYAAYTPGDENTNWTLTIWKEYWLNQGNHEQTFEELAVSLKNDWVKAYKALQDLFYPANKVN